MSLTNQGDKDYHIYEINENKITSIGIPTMDNCNDDPDDKLGQSYDCGAAIRKNFEEEDGTTVTVDPVTKKQTNCGQDLQSTLMWQEQNQILKITNPINGNPTWDYEYIIKNQPNSPATSGSPKKSVAYWINQRFGQGFPYPKLQQSHVERIAEDYLLIGDKNKNLINERGRQLLLKKVGMNSHIYKSYDFLYQNVLRIYGLKKLPKFGNNVVEYKLKSQIWLRPFLISTTKGINRINLKVIANGKEEPICAKNIIFYSKSAQNSVGIGGSSFNVRIDYLIQPSDFDDIAGKIRDTIPLTVAAWETWKSNLAAELNNVFQGGGKFQLPPYIEPDKSCAFYAGLSSTTPGAIFVGSKVTVGNGNPDEALALKYEATYITVNPENVASCTPQVQARRAADKQRTQLFSAYFKNQAADLKAAVGASIPASATTDTQIDLTKPINTEKTGRDGVIEANDNQNNKGETTGTVVNQVEIILN
jgi:hypothetical protein